MICLGEIFRDARVSSKSIHDSQWVCRFIFPDFALPMHILQWLQCTMRRLHKLKFLWVVYVQWCPTKSCTLADLTLLGCRCIHIKVGPCCELADALCCPAMCVAMCAPLFPVWIQIQVPESWIIFSPVCSCVILDSSGHLPSIYVS